MPLAQTQSLPTWAPMKPSAASAAVVCKPAFDDEDPLYLSGEETDCDSDRGSDTLSREDQQLMASFIRLQRDRAHKQLFHKDVSRPAFAAGPRASPVLIPAQTRKYVATSTKRWLWDEDDEEDEDADQCPCCIHHPKAQPQSECRTATSPATAEASDAAASDLIFDLEL